MHKNTAKYNKALKGESRAIAEALAAEIDRGLPDAENVARLRYGRQPVRRGR